MIRRSILTFAASAILFHQIPAQDPANYDEDRAGQYVLPSLLVTEEGHPIRSAEEWEKKQRPAILQKFATHVYGRMPGRPKDFHFKENALEPNALDGKAIRKEVTLYFTKGDQGPALHLLVYLPKNHKGPVPVCLGLNFQGNHSTQTDPGITITDQWKSLHPGTTNPERGGQARRWPVEEILSNGFALVTAYYEELEPDHPEGWRTGIRTTLSKELEIKPHEWGAIGAWAWGLSRIMDYLESEPAVNPAQVVLTGHSRLGKAALWAGANDRRFAIVVSNDSGEGGAALARRNFGETVQRINTAFPHWFIEKYKTYNHAVDQLPVDQHMLLALMAPRPLYVASASGDLWADPKGEFLGALHAGPVYALYGQKGLMTEQQPPIGQPVGETIAYHIREGKHDILLYDWKQYLRFASRHFKTGQTK